MKYWESETFEEAKQKVLTIKNFEEANKHDLEILKHLDLRKEDLILDFGCGIGRLVEILEKNHQIVGIDSSTTMIKYALEKCKSPFRISDGSDLPIETFDKIYSFLVMQHLERFEVFKTLYYLRNALKKGGKMLIQFPDLYKNKDFMRLYLFKKGLYKELQPRMEFYTKKELEFLFESLELDYQIIEEGTDFYILAQKIRELNLPHVFMTSEKWKD